MAGIYHNYVPIRGSERRAAPTAKLLGPADNAQKVTVTIVVRRRVDGARAPDVDTFSTGAVGTRGRLAPAEFAAKYGASQEDLEKVRAFLVAHGVQVVEMHAARRSIVASGTVQQMNEAFRVALGRYQHEVAHNSESQPVVEEYRGREGDISVPTELAPIIMGVFGLDNRRITKRNAADPPNTATITVSKMTGLYQFPTNSAAGQTIAIFSTGGYAIADIRQQFGAAAPSVTDVSVGATNPGADDEGETTQDICIAAAAAPGAAIAVYFTTGDQQGWIGLVQRVAHPSPGDPDCSVLSSSFYVSDGDDAATLANESVTVSWLTALSAAFQDAALQGVTVCIASGDTGTDSKVGDGHAHVQYPGSDPWVLSVGGTTVGNINGPLFDEYLWNDTFGNGGSGATGGGISDYFPLPAYQANANVPGSLNDGHKGRGVPDVAANASPNSGYPIILKGQPGVGDGTSASAPLWAGLIAVINAALGKRVGFINPALYAVAVAGIRNILPVPGATDNGVNGVAGYPARVGWDACTGWGSPNGMKLLAALSVAAAAPAASAPTSIATNIPSTTVPAITPPPTSAAASAPARVGLGVSMALLVVGIVLDAWATQSTTNFVKLGPTLPWLVELVLIAALFATLGFSFKGLWFGILVDGRNKIALSRLQIVLWTIFFTATFLIVYAWNFSFVLDVHHKPIDLRKLLDLIVPDAVWLLMGMAGISAAASPLILNAKAAPDPSKPALLAPKDSNKFLDGVLVKRWPDARPQWSDIILGDEAGIADEIDISKVQQLVLSLVAMASYGASLVQVMTRAAATNGHVLSAGRVIPELPGMTGGFLALIAASHATYLGYKSVSHTS